MSAPRVWGIHGGKTGDAFNLFTQENVIALGWAQVSDLSVFPDDQAAFRQVVTAAFPAKKPGAVAVDAGQLRRFVHELQTGEIVAFSAKADWTFRIGRVTGGYRYDPSGDGSYPHRRPVEWLKTIKRDELSQSARFELGAAMSFFRVKRHAAEILALIGLDTGVEGGGVVFSEGGEEQPDVLSAGQVEEATREFVLERLRALYAGHALEEFVGDLLRAMGYQAEVTQKSGDHGVDVVAGRGALGLDPPILKVQVKSGQGAVGEPDLLKLNGSIEQAQGERGVVVSLGGFSPPALKWKQGKQWFQLVGPGDLVDLVLEHYDPLDVVRQRRIGTERRGVRPRRERDRATLRRRHLADRSARRARSPHRPTTRLLLPLPLGAGCRRR